MGIVPHAVKAVPSVLQASSNLQLLQNNQNSTATLGTIFFSSISQNQSYAVAEAVRFALLPSSDFNTADPANAPAYHALTANIGAATAYAMHYAAQKVRKGLQDCVMCAPRVDIWRSLAVLLSRSGSGEGLDRVHELT